MNKTQIWELTANLSLGWALLMALLIHSFVGTLCMGIGLVVYVRSLHKQMIAMYEEDKVYKEN